MSRVRSLRPRLGALLVVLAASSAQPAEVPRAIELRSQRVGDVTYFQVRFTLPSDLRLPPEEGDDAALPAEARRHRLARLPILVPQDDQTTAVYYAAHLAWANRPHAEGLEFVGKIRDEGKAHLRLLYPTEKQRPTGRDLNPASWLEAQTWEEVDVVLDLAKAKPVKRPKGKRLADQKPEADDLEGQWAAAQAYHFAVREAQVPDSGFFGFAREATGRKYHVPARPIGRAETVRSGEENRRLYEMTTGATALTESLALRRMLGRGGLDRDERIIDVARLPGIEIAQHPWNKMMAGKTPDPEPLAKLVPHDNYYVAFKSVRKFLEFNDQLDEWGTSLIRAYEVTSRDYGLKERYERQLCLRSKGLGRTLGPALIRGVALTGNDLYLREGSDLTFIFEVNNRALFLAAVEPFLEEARKEFGNRLKETQTEYAGATVESFVTPLREVSLHRAAVGDFVIYSNSAVALRRSLDARRGKIDDLAGSPDFQYMRTIFRRDDKDEDGFAFLSDAFIRQLVGPASKIKEKRRLEALTSLQMVTDAALFAAWETGQLPAKHKDALTAARLKKEDVLDPQGDSVTWDGVRHVATSPTYNTLHFATPLVELPISRVTPQEERDYRAFREQYLGLWRRFFDPVGMRFTFGDKQVRVETYILPLIQSSQYNDLRAMAGNTTTRFERKRLLPHTVAQFLVSADNRYMQEVLDNWIAFRLDDSPVFRRRLELQILRELDPSAELQKESERLFWRLPVAVGIGVKDGDKFAEEMRSLWRQVGLGKGEPKKYRYKKVLITRVQVDEERYRQLAGFLKAGTQEGTFGPLFAQIPTEVAPPELFQAVIDGGYYFSFTESALTDLIDQVEARRKNGPGEEVNAAFYLKPSATRALEALTSYLEYESQRRAVGNGPLWQLLYRTGLMKPDDSTVVQDAVARKYLGFVPVSPDGTPYRYDVRGDDVLSVRHGSLRRPEWHDRLDDKSPLRGLLGRLRTLRADLRFREDGVHTVVTFEWQGPGK
jgi:hypothetical protein